MVIETAHVESGVGFLCALGSPMPTQERGVRTRLLSRRNQPRQQVRLDERQQADETGQHDAVEEDEAEDASLRRRAQRAVVTPSA